MDGRTVKGGTAGRGAHSVVPRVSHTTEPSDEKPSTSPPRTWGEGIRSCSQGIKGGGGEESDSLESDKVRTCNDGLVGGSENENPVAAGLEGKVRPAGGRAALSRETERTMVLARRGGCRGSCVHPAPLPAFTHVAQGR